MKKKPQSKRKSKANMGPTIVPKKKKVVGKPAFPKVKIKNGRKSGSPKKTEE